jgi:uncharacterized membrane protein
MKLNNYIEVNSWVVFLVLLVLKASGTLNMSWWVVTLPLWIIPVTFFSGFIGYAMLAVGFGLLFLILEHFDRRR